MPYIPVAVVNQSAGGGGITSLFHQTLLADAASIDTGANGIAQTATTLIVRGIVRTTQAIGISTVSVTINGNTGANYDKEFLQGVDASASAGNNIAQTAWVFACSTKEMRSGVRSATCCQWAEAR